MASPQKLLIHCRRSPYSCSLARGGIELAMAAAVFDQDVALLFSGDGIWQLMAEQSSENIADKNHGKLVSALPLYGVAEIFVDRDSLQSRSLSLEDLCVEARCLDKSDITQLMAQSRQVFNF